jgi:DNA repair ATPase RecN
MSYPDEGAYNTALLDKCEAEGIELIAVTDHWNVDSAMQLIRDAKARGIVALPGFEANSSEGVHILVIFEEGTKASTVNAAIGKCGGDPGNAGKTGEPFKTILESMAEIGAVAIPAHANIAKSGMLTSRSGAPLIEMVHHKNLHAIGVSPAADDGTDQKQIFARTKPYDRPHPLARVFADDVCSPDTLGKVGATTWFKVSKPCLASIRHALLIPSTRVRTKDPATVPRAILREISWRGGFLDGVTITFSDDLTNLIGGRGTGKSTIVESLRYVLAIAPLGENSAKDHDGIVKDVLGSGATIRLVVSAVTPTAGEYTIQRTVFGQSIVLDSAGVPTQLRPEDVIGSVDIYGQHELAELAQDSSRVAEMITRFSSPSTAATDRRALLAKLSDNRARLEKGEKALSKLENELADIPRLEAQAERFKDTKIADRLSELKRMRQDQAVFAAARERIEEAEEFVDGLASPEIVASLTSGIDLIAGSKHEAILRKAEAATSVVGKEIETVSAHLATAVQAARDIIESAEKEWTKSTSKKKAEHDQVLRELTEEGADPEKYLATIGALEALKIRATQVPTSRTAISTLSKERKALLGELNVNETALNRELSDMIRDANAATSGAIRIQAVQSPKRDDLVDLVTKSIPGQRTQVVAAINEDGFSVPALVAAARSGPDRLEKEFYIKGAQAAAIAAAGEHFFRQFEEMRVEQAVDVSLDTSIGSGSANWKKLNQLSKGQRATALLLLLLGASRSPLIIDQPEDDLDNRFVFKEIVKKLRNLKGTRQVISSTHNANIPVLGDAELIVVLEGNGTNAWIAKDGEGSLDNPIVLEFAEDLLEGGREAFTDRQHLYGF